MYAEAEVAARRLDLKGLVPPVTAAQLADQQQRNTDKYLAPSVPLEQVNIM